MSSSQAAIVALGSALPGAVIAVGSAIADSRYAALYYDDADSESGDYPVPRAKAVSRSRSRSRGNLRRRLSMDGVGRVTKIALTGGPCGGKSSCLNQVMKRLQEQGYMVFVAPEMPTMLKPHCECPFPFVPDASVADSAHMLCWEGNKMRMQQELEDSLHDIAASSGKKTVIICDRGLPDSAAYTSEHEFQTILDCYAYNRKAVRPWDQLILFKKPLPAMLRPSKSCAAEGVQRAHLSHVLRKVVREPI